MCGIINNGEQTCSFTNATAVTATATCLSGAQQRLE